MTNLLLLAILLAGAGHAVDASAVQAPSRICEDARGTEAYAFGLKIQDAVRERDLTAFFSLIPGELERGPRRSHAAGKAFGQVFPESWREAVLATKPDCLPVGWRGFMLGQGQVWYRSDGVFAVNGWTPEAVSPPPVGWRFDGNLLSPVCFAYQSPSGDVFEELADRFAIADSRDAPEFTHFEHDIGRYFGNPIRPFGREGPNLWRYIDDCAENSGSLATDDSAVMGGGGERYAALAGVPVGLCQSLAPNLPGKCLESHLLHRFSRTSGSMGHYGVYGIYGLFEMEEGAKVVFPLKYFDSENLARNFLED